MKTFSYALLAMVLLIGLSGCGSDKERGMNRPDQKRDLPRAAPSENHK